MVSDEKYKPQFQYDPLRQYSKDDPENNTGKDGFFFWNESWDVLHGPYETMEECKAALKKYANNL